MPTFSVEQGKDRNTTRFELTRRAEACEECSDWLSRSCWMSWRSYKDMPCKEGWLKRRDKSPNKPMLLVVVDAQLQKLVSKLPIELRIELHIKLWIELQIELQACKSSSKSRSTFRLSCEPNLLHCEAIRLLECNNTHHLQPHLLVWHYLVATVIGTWLLWITPMNLIIIVATKGYSYCMPLVGVQFRSSLRWRRGCLNEYNWQ